MTFNDETLKMLLDIAGNDGKLRTVAWALAGALDGNLDERPQVVSNRPQRTMISVRLQGRALRISREKGSIRMHSESGGLEECFSGESRIEDFIKMLQPATI
ncbi:MAG TPA: hypothetical protein VK557_14170 [Pyrinomonadaceae bacterium]|nr:hypothetical protein [Pyrinomonadaceae bacterium]